MFRKLAAILLIALALATLAVYARAVMAPLTLTIGSAPIALVQTGSVVTSTGTQFSATLPVPSTAGTTIIAIAVTSTAVAIVRPFGWTEYAATPEGANSYVTLEAYVNNPGGVSAVTFSAATSATWYAFLSEWSGLQSDVFPTGVSVMFTDATGTATATAGTTLPMVTNNPVTGLGDLAIAAWVQVHAANTATFTSPSGFTRLLDNGATSQTVHVDAEYQLRPSVGSLLLATMTSNRTTTSAAGYLFTFTRAPQAVDQTSYLAY